MEVRPNSQPGMPIENEEDGAEPALPRPASGSLLRLVFREERFFLILSVFIGIFSGLAVVCFRFAIDWCRIYLLGSGAMLTPLRLVLAPTLAGLVIAALMIHVFPLARGSGVNQTKAALYIYNGYIPLRTAIGKFITAALAIGSGHSLGPEDPSLQIGASLASALGRRMHLSRDRMRLIAPVGAAAGLAAAFNAPISAVLFVIEEVIGRWTAGIRGSVVLSAVSSVVVMRWFLGSEFLFRIPAVQLERPSELIAYAILGVVGGLASVAFAKGIAAVRPWCKELPRWTQYFQPAIAGLLIGTIAVLGAPQIMGAGYEYIDQAMHGPVYLANAGYPGGTEDRCHAAFIRQRYSGRDVCSNPVHRRHAGCGGGGSGTCVSAPLERIPRHLRVGGHGRLVRRIPASAHDFSLHGAGGQRQLLNHRPRHRGQHVRVCHLPRAAANCNFRRADTPGRSGTAVHGRAERRGDLAGGRRDASRPVALLDAEEPLERAWQQLNETSPEVLLVRLNPTGWSSVTRDELETMIKEGKGNLTLVSVLASRQIPYVHPDHPLEVALRHVDRWPLVPVVSRADFRKLEGVISQQDVLERYRGQGEE